MIIFFTFAQNSLVLQLRKRLTKRINSKYSQFLKCILYNHSVFLHCAHETPHDDHNIYFILKNLKNDVINAATIGCSLCVVRKSDLMLCFLLSDISVLFYNVTVRMYRRACTTSFKMNLSFLFSYSVRLIASKSVCDVKKGPF